MVPAPKKPLFYENGARDERAFDHYFDHQVLFWDRDAKNIFIGKRSDRVDLGTGPFAKRYRIEVLVDTVQDIAQRFRFLNGFHGTLLNWAGTPVRSHDRDVRADCVPVGGKYHKFGLRKKYNVIDGAIR